MARMPKNSLALTKRCDRLTPIWSWESVGESYSSRLALLRREDSNAGGLGSWASLFLLSSG
jgi:hypothetical protein